MSALINQKARHFIEDTYALYEHMAPFVCHTPLISTSLDNKTFLKCENLQYTHSFKYRAAFSVLFFYEKRHPEIWQQILKHGIITYSTGNFAKALAFITEQKKIKLTVLVHDSIDSNKINEIIETNPSTEILKISKKDWENSVLTSTYENLKGFFVSAAVDYYATLGHATIGVEILQQMPSIHSVIIPHGSGGLTYGLSRFLKFFKKHIKIYTVEVIERAPLFKSFSIGQPVKVPYKKTFVDALSADFLIPDSFYKILPLIEKPLVVTSERVAAAVLELAFEHKIITEGAGAAAWVAATCFEVEKPVCCILSGGNIKKDSFLKLLDLYKKDMNINKQEAFCE